MFNTGKSYMDLFEQAENLNGKPLAARMRPRNLDEFIGQEAIVGKGRLLRRAIKADQISSLIFYGPPGTGKTTLAQIIAASTKSKFLSLNAVLAGVKDLREAIEEAKEQKRLYGRKTILFVDEVHRWNKSQQDALLPWTENGTIVLIGATTENPFFEVNRALVSRSRIFQLQSLTDADLMQAARLALTDKERGYGLYNVTFEKGALEHLVTVAKGDCRSFYNALELAVETTPEHFPPPEGEAIYISLETAEESIQKRALLYDKEGDYHFDTISAFIKSLRGSDPDAALYWMARMVLSGEDIDYIWRRMLISAAEDIGLADPNAIQVVLACSQAYERLGMPEGQFPLTEAALYLATAPKSNSALAYYDAVKLVQSEAPQQVPNHLKDPSRDGAALGHGRGYKYPHAFTGHWTAQAYMPEALRGRVFYQPTDEGFEGALKEQILYRRELQLAVILNDETQDEEALTFTPALLGKRRNEWIKRSEAGLAHNLLELRTLLFEALRPVRHSTVLIDGDRSGFLVAEAMRRTAEGSVTALLPDESLLNAVEAGYAGLDALEKPILLKGSLKTFPDAGRELPARFDRVLLFMPNYPAAEIVPLLKRYGAPQGRAVAVLPGVGTVISRLLAGKLPAELLHKIEAGESRLYAERQESWYRKQFIGANYKLLSRCFEESALITAKTAEQWLDAEGRFGQMLQNESVSDDERRLIAAALAAAGEKPIAWQRCYYIFDIEL
jgi:putative ATPase